MREGGGIVVEEDKVVELINVGYSAGIWRHKKYVTSLARSGEWSCLS